VNVKVKTSDVILKNRKEAESVLDCLRDLFKAHKAVSLGEFYELCGIEGTWTDEYQGWDDLTSAEIVQTGDGYTISLPDPKQLI
jgi:hypothetical protein